MIDDTHDIPKSLRQLNHAVRTFAAGARLMNDDARSGRSLAAATDKFETAALAMIAQTVRRTDAKSLKSLAAEIAPAVETLAGLTEAFCEDAALGRAALPPMDDVRVGVGLMQQQDGALMALLHNVAGARVPVASAERSALSDGLADVGAPVEMLGLPHPGLIKVLLLLIIIVIARRTDGRVEAVIIIMFALAVIDEEAQPYEPYYHEIPKGVDPEGIPDDLLPEGLKPKPKKSCETRPRISIGDGEGPTQAQAAVAAILDVFNRKAGECRPPCQFRPLAVRFFGNAQKKTPGMERVILQVTYDCG